ncbi:hypothetical protein FC99_GL001220 [Levilactobacillus koreensis JCM 16448]|uniref:Uncharacterized protein n=1 Tax=Levilactobacillus koreensis TaxID=637971 RepID=A0AAC9ERH5_9LACO|nr:hypothetical protein [Levilactobacillus koreensis]AKP65084.1 hypothetical protein ABN16_08780 [Levilactobacillus koreensis]KRK86679.1 hypothetical protein FC99_GL001220 [Levilactobacillus koreensis JCM 16448]
MKISREFIFHWLGYNKVTKHYSKWCRVLTYLFWPLAALEAIAWFVGGDVWWTLLVNGLAALYLLVSVPSFAIELIRIAYRDDQH